MNKEKLAIIKVIANANSKRIKQLAQEFEIDAAISNSNVVTENNETVNNFAPDDAMRAIKAILNAEEIISCNKCVTGNEYDCSSGDEHEIDTKYLKQQHIKALNELSIAQKYLIYLFNYSEPELRNVDPTLDGFNFTSGSYSFSVLPYHL